MTALAFRERSGTAGFGGTFRLSAGRLLRLELRRGPMLWMLPVIVALFWFDTFRSSMALAPLWGARTLLLREGTALTDFAPFVAGAAAWAGSRDGRRGTTEQVAVTALPRWAAQLAAWTATTCWALVAYGGCVGALYAVTASQVTGGDPLWWPVAVSAAGVVAISALGFAAGVWFPSRFTAPVAAIVSLVTLMVTRQMSGTYMMITPMKSPSSLGAPLPEDGVFHSYLPDLSITQLSFLAGLVIAGLGTLGLRAGGGLRLRGMAAAFTTAGVAVAATTLGLVGSGHVSADGVIIPAVHDAARDRPISVTPVCGSSSIPICLNPVYRTYLPVLTTALTPILNEVAGLPGAPVRTAQVEFTDPYPHLAIATVSGRPPVLNLALNFGYRGAMLIWYGSGPPPMSIADGSSARLWSSVSLVRAEALPPIAVTLVRQVVGQNTQAQRAISAALLTVAGVPAAALDSPLIQAGAPAQPKLSTTPAAVNAAAQRFAALPASERRSWLTAHLPALRSGHLTLGQLP